MSTGTEQQQQQQQQQPQQQQQQQQQTEQQKVGGELRSLKILKIIAAYLDSATEEKRKLKEKVNSCFHFEIFLKQGQPPALKWTIDLRADGGSQTLNPKP